MASTYRYQHLMRLSANELHNYLEGKKNYSPELRENLKTVVTRQKDEKANARRRRAQVERQWQPLLDALSREKKKVRACMNYTAQGEAGILRAQALKEYHNALRTLLSRFRLALKEDITPQQLRDELQQQGRKLPNNGEHWVDWITDRKRASIELAFQSIPHNRYARTLTPFQRDTNRGT